MSKLLRGAVALILGGVIMYQLVLPVLRPPWLKSALADTESLPEARNLRFFRLARGFEGGTLDVTVGGRRVDRLRFIRVEPEHFNLAVRYDPEKPVLAEDWVERLGACAIINGSYYLEGYHAETPLRVDDAAYGPDRYTSSHGAFVIDERPQIIDLNGRDVSAALQPYRDAMVSYPLLVEPSGESRARGDATWLANRSFVGLDKEGRVILGMTEGGYFSLRRFGKFLSSSGLDLSYALNLDGGPISSLAVSIGGFRSVHYGQWELNDKSGEIKKSFSSLRSDRWVLPIVLAVLPKRGAPSCGEQIR